LTGRFTSLLLHDHPADLNWFLHGTYLNKEHNIARQQGMAMPPIIADTPAPKLAVILVTGSFSPVTYMHLQLLERARDAAIARGFSVLHGLLSPAHDSYDKSGLLAASHRVAMAKLALESSPWASASHWEVKQNSYSPTYKVAEWARTSAGSSEGDVEVVLACGADLVENMIVSEKWPVENVRRLLGRAVLAVMQRPGADVENALEARVFDGFRDRIWLVDGVASDISSSVVRFVCTLIHAKFAGIQFWLSDIHVYR
jgi:nicotinate (nicotinamide) nucleotide adenylyltransferase